jgi:GT2 family glycosyltransferase
VVVVDDGSTDGTAAWLARSHPHVRVVRRARNGGFAAAANAGLAAVRDADWVALVNTDVEPAPDWLARALAAGEADARCASVATKLVRADDPSVIDDAGDALRRDGVCEQRGRGHRDDGRWSAAGEVWGACAGAALYRRAAVDAVGGFDERLVNYLEDVDLALRLRLAGWTCRYEPVAARHAGGGSSALLAAPVRTWVARNTLLLVARAFPWRWLPWVAYRQSAWMWAAARDGRGALAAHARGVAAAVPLLPAMWRERRALRGAAVVAIDEVVGARPIRGPRAGGHPRGAE